LRRATYIELEETNTGLRFFTVYSPWGRPDMALFKFTRGILAGELIPVYNEGRMVRDFTHVDGVESVTRLIPMPLGGEDIGTDSAVETDAP
jgi:nucleoside-diphosphate-sugar epimerase